MLTYEINAIYPAYQGEVNIHGIGAPVIFVRLQGCHLRCYKSTMGTLCDTPESLEGVGGETQTIAQVLSRVMKESKKMGGTKLICLSGGDPLWRKVENVKELLWTFSKNGFLTSIETSGTLSIAPYRKSHDVSFVLDYKLKSAGIKQPFIVNDLGLLNQRDFIKFVVYDEEDYLQAIKVITEYLPKTRAKFAVGTYWGGKISSSQLFKKLCDDSLMGRVVLNVQLHKMVTFCDLNLDVLGETYIPQQI